MELWKRDGSTFIIMVQSIQSSDRMRDISFSFLPIATRDSFTPAENVGLQKFGVRPRDDYPNSLRAALLTLSRRW